MKKRIILAIQAARIAGEIIISSHPLKGSTSKDGRVNFVTAADLASEKAIINHINKTYPNDNILSEETHSKVNNPLSVPHLWVIDPIDGTNNFRRERAYSAVSIGYIERGEMVAGVIYNPFRDELFTAEKGEGAFLNSDPIHVAEETDLTKTEITTENWYDPDGTRKNLELFFKLNKIPFMLMKGSSVLDLAEVACGRIDLFMQNFLKPWDSAAGFLLVREAGGVVKDLKGNDVSFLSPQAIAGNATLVEQFIQKVR